MSKKPRQHFVYLPESDPKQQSADQRGAAGGVAPRQFPEDINRLAASLATRFTMRNGQALFAHAIADERANARKRIQDARCDLLELAAGALQEIVTHCAPSPLTPGKRAAIHAISTSTLRDVRRVWDALDAKEKALAARRARRLARRLERHEPEGPGWYGLDLEHANKNDIFLPDANPLPPAHKPDNTGANENYGRVKHLGPVR
jgi:hypothetical protein